VEKYDEKIIVGYTGKQPVEVFIFDNLRIPVIKEIELVGSVQYACKMIKQGKPCNENERELCLNIFKVRSAHEQVETEEVEACRQCYSQKFGSGDIDRYMAETAEQAKKDMTHESTRADQPVQQC
jgi:hypothetical protein